MFELIRIGAGRAVSMGELITEKIPFHEEEGEVEPEEDDKETKVKRKGKRIDTLKSEEVASSDQSEDRNSSQSSWDEHEPQK